MSIVTMMQAQHRHCDALLAQAEAAARRKDWMACAEAAGVFHRRYRSASRPGRKRAVSRVRAGHRHERRADADDAHRTWRNARTDGGPERGDRGAGRRDFLGCCETLLILLQQHNMKEENILYPMCDRAVPEFAATLVSSAERAAPVTGYIDLCATRRARAARARPRLAGRGGAGRARGIPAAAHAVSAVRPPCATALRLGDPGSSPTGVPSSSLRDGPARDQSRLQPAGCGAAAVFPHRAVVAAARRTAVRGACGRAVLASRLHPATLAITHLLMLGFAGNVMIGALMQISAVAGRCARAAAGAGGLAGMGRAAGRNSACSRRACGGCSHCCCRRPGSCSV